MSRWKAACPNPPPKGGGGKKESVDPAQIPKRLGNGSNARDAPNGQRKGVAFPSETQQSSTWQLFSVVARQDRPARAQPHELHENG